MSLTYALNAFHRPHQAQHLAIKTARATLRRTRKCIGHRLPRLKPAAQVLVSVSQRSRLTVAASVRTSWLRGRPCSPGQEFAEPAGEVPTGEPVDGVGEVGFQVEAVQLGGLDQV